jgi:hypothetical protein
MMMPSVVSAEYEGGHRIRLSFSDGTVKTVDFRRWLDGLVFEPFKDPSYFQRFFLEAGTVVWPNGADIAPETLYGARGVRTKRSNHRIQRRAAPPANGAPVAAEPRQPAHPESRQTASSRRNSMKTSGRVVLFLFVVTGTLMTVSQAQAAVSCHKINAKGVGQDLGGGQTEADIIGGGLLQGTTAGSFVITGFSGTVASIEGTVVFTTNNGTLTVTVAGIFDVATGQFSASGTVTSATGKLEGATGTLLLEGIQDLSSGRFVEDVTGTICVDLAP